MPPRGTAKPAQKGRAATAAASAAPARATKSTPQIAAKSRKAAPVPQRFTAQEDDEEEDEGDNEEAAADEEDLSDSEEAAAVEAEEEDADGAEDAEDDDDAADPQDDGGEDAADEDGAEAEAEGAEEDDEAEDSGEDDVELSAEDAEMLAAEEAAEREAEEAAQGQGEGDEDAETDALPAASKSPHALTLDAATSAAYAAAMEARGVVYISRIPPYMKAAKLRWLLQQMIPPTRKHGRIGRIFLTPEDASFARKRKKAGGNTGKKFVDGWVEFESKKVARWLAETYNTQPIGGPKRSRYVEDLWTLKYLSGFKWNHLTEKIAYEKTIRSTKIREEISQAKKDSEYYLAQVERSNKLEKKGGQQQKRKRGDEGDAAPAHKAQRTFHQRSLLDNKKPQQAKKPAAAAAQR